MGVTLRLDTLLGDEPFNPEGAGYDYASARSAGLGPDETGHWPSRVPDTGLLLKGRTHPTWSKTQEGEAAAGMKIYQGEGGRYYSRPQSGPVSLSVDDLLTQPEEFQQAQEQQAIEHGEMRPSPVGPYEAAIRRGVGNVALFIPRTYKRLAEMPASEVPKEAVQLAKGAAAFIPQGLATVFAPPSREGELLPGPTEAKYGLTTAEHSRLVGEEPYVPTGPERVQAATELGLGLVLPKALERVREVPKPVPTITEAPEITRALQRAAVRAEIPEPVGRLLTPEEVRAKQTPQGMDIPTFQRRGLPEPPNRVVTGPEGEQVIPAPQPKTLTVEDLLKPEEAPAETSQLQQLRQAPLLTREQIHALSDNDALFAVNRLEQFTADPENAGVHWRANLGGEETILSQYSRPAPGWEKGYVNMFGEFFSEHEKALAAIYARAELDLNAMKRTNAAQKEAQAKPAETVVERPAHLPRTVEDVLAMEPEQIRQAAADLKQYEADAAIEVFGPERAKAYERAQRTVNSSTIDTRSPRYLEAEKLIADMESGLSEAQQRRLFGIGEKGPGFEEVQDLARNASGYDRGLLAEETTQSLLGRFARLAGGERQATDLLVRYALPRVYQLLRERGMSDTDLVAATLGRMGERGINAETAGEALSVRLKQMQEAQPATPAPLQAPISPEVPPEPAPALKQLPAGQAEAPAPITVYRGAEVASPVSGGLFFSEDPRVSDVYRGKTGNVVEVVIQPKKPISWFDPLPEPVKAALLKRYGAPFQEGLDNAASTGYKPVVADVLELDTLSEGKTWHEDQPRKTFTIPREVVVEELRKAGYDAVQFRAALMPGERPSWFVMDRSIIKRGGRLVDAKALGDQLDAELCVEPPAARTPPFTLAEEVKPPTLTLPGETVPPVEMRQPAGVEQARGLLGQAAEAKPLTVDNLLSEQPVTPAVTPTTPAEAGPPAPPKSLADVLVDLPQPPSQVSLTKAGGQEIRARLGLDQLTPPTRQAFEDVWEDAKSQRMADHAMDVALDAVTAKRALTPQEHAGMVQHYLDLEQDLAASRHMLADAVQTGNDLVAARETARGVNILSQIDRLTEATDRLGTEAGRALSIRRLRANLETYDLAHTLQTMRAQKGAPLTVEEIQRAEQVSKPIQDLQKENAVLQAESDAVAVQQAKSVAEAVTRVEAKAPPTEKLDALIAKQGDILKELQGLGYRLNDITGVSTEGLYLIGKLAVEKIKTAVAQGQRNITLDGIVQSVLTDLNNPDLTAKDVYIAMNMKSPKVKAQAALDAQQQVRSLKSQARLLVDIEHAEQGLFPPKGAPKQPGVIVQALQKRLTALRTEAYKSGVLPDRLEKSLQTISELQDQLNNFYRTIKAKQTPPGPQLADLQNRIKGLRQEMRVEDQLADVMEQLRTKDFKLPPERQPTYVSPKLEQNRIALRHARRLWQEEVEKLGPITPQRAVLETAGLLRAFKATADVSATLRQGFWLAARRPLTTADALSKSLQAMFSEKTADQIDAQIFHHPNQILRDRAGLQLTETGGRLGQREEYFTSRLAERIPGIGHVIRASNRAMSTTLNVMRSSAFDQFLDAYPNATLAEMKAWADWVNVATGRGEFPGALAGAAGPLSAVIFAPRFTMSRFQTPFRLFKYWKEPRVRAEIAKDYAAVAAVGLTTLALASLAGADVGLDPHSADFGKMKIGDMHVDLWAGVQQPMRLLAQIALYGPDKAGWTTTDTPEDPWGVVGRFAQFKLSPLLSVPHELLTGKTAVGETVTPSETAIRSVIPLVFDDTYDAYRRMGPLAAAATWGLSTTGVGVSVYGPKGSSSRSRSRQRARRPSR